MQKLYMTGLLQASGLPTLSSRTPGYFRSITNFLQTAKPGAPVAILDIGFETDTTELVAEAISEWTDRVSSVQTSTSQQGVQEANRLQSKYPHLQPRLLILTAPPALQVPLPLLPSCLSQLAGSQVALDGMLGTYCRRSFILATRYRVLNANKPQIHISAAVASYLRARKGLTRLLYLLRTRLVETLLPKLDAHDMVIDLLSTRKLLL